jgi:O-antigen/teichoic acid export membrane protein
MKHLKQISIYTFVSFLGAGINFFLMPYLSYFINPAEYGILSLLNTFVTILIPLIGLVASGLITVEYYRLTDKKDFAALFASIQFIPLIPGFFLLLITFIFPQALAKFLEIPADKSYWLSISIILGIFSIYFETLLAYNIIKKKPVQYALFSISKLLVEVLLTVWFISRLHLGWEGRMWSWLISTVIFGLIAIAYFSKQGLFKEKIVWKYVIAGVSFGLPLIIHTIGKFVINQSNRIFIAKMVSLDEAGIYNIGAQVGMVILLLANSIGNFYQPFLFERLANPTPQSQSQIIKFNYSAMIGLFLCLILLTLGTPLFFHWFVSKKYANATIYVFWVGLGYLFWSIYLLYTGVIFYHKKTNFLGLLAMINILLSIILNYFLIKSFGALGAAYASCISYFIVALIVVRKAYTLNKFSRVSVLPV